MAADDVQAEPDVKQDSQVVRDRAACFKAPSIRTAYLLLDTIDYIPSRVTNASLILDYKHCRDQIGCNCGTAGGSRVGEQSELPDSLSRLGREKGARLSLEEFK